VFLTVCLHFFLSSHASLGSISLCELGHLGDVTVEHVAFHLPIIVRDFLRDALTSDTSCDFTPELIGDLFSRSIVAFDDAIANDVLELFGGLEGLDNFSDAQIRSIINDQHSGGANWKKARLCMYGTTALVALVDPDHNNLWIANLGDCQAREFCFLTPARLHSNISIFSSYGNPKRRWR
jgi:pyruvate dehydrogenase phosphatase